MTRHEVLAWVSGELGSAIAQTERLQSLWSGYGELFRAVLADGRRVVVKWVRPPSEAASGSSSASAERKLRSYDVELAFYRALALRCDDTCRVPRLLAFRGSASEREWILVLEDLDALGFERRVDEANDIELHAALAWLASFHARFLGERPAGLWSVGSYWHLDTRRDELSSIADSELRGAAPRIAQRLASARFSTVLHGDPKEANFCFMQHARAVAAVDFQYVGPGAGIIDVAYLLHGRVDEPPDGIDAARLDVYFRELRSALARRSDAAPPVNADALEVEWRMLYPIARLDFCRFLAGWRPAMWRNDARGRRFVRAQLQTLP